MSATFNTIRDKIFRNKKESDLSLPFKKLAHSKDVFKNVGFISYKIEREQEPPFYSFKDPKEGVLGSATYVGNGTIVSAAHVFGGSDYSGYSEMLDSNRERVRFYFNTVDENNKLAGTYEIRTVYVHPDSKKNSFVLHADLCIGVLKEKIPNLGGVNPQLKPIPHKITDGTSVGYPDYIAPLGKGAVKVSTDDSIHPRLAVSAPRSLKFIYKNATKVKANPDSILDYDVLTFFPGYDIEVSNTKSVTYQRREAQSNTETALQPGFSGGMFFSQGQYLGVNAATIPFNRTAILDKNRDIPKKTIHEFNMVEKVLTFLALPYIKLMEDTVGSENHVCTFSAHSEWMGKTLERSKKNFEFFQRPEVRDFKPNLKVPFCGALLSVLKERKPYLDVNFARQNVMNSSFYQNLRNQYLKPKGR